MVLCDLGTFREKRSEVRRCCGRRALPDAETERMQDQRCYLSSASLDTKGSAWRGSACCRVKIRSAAGALESIREVTGENTVIMSLMNGVDSEELIAEKAGSSHMLYSLIKVASHKEGEGYCFDPDTTIGIVFGELSAPYDSDRVRAVEELFADTGIHFRHTELIREEIWSKFLAQCLQQSATGDLRRGRRLLSTAYI